MKYLACILTFLSLHSVAVQAACPDLSLGETPLDCPWAQVTRDWDSRESNFLENHLPALATQMSQDAKLTEWKGLWGTSINYDELALGIIVRPEILKDLARTFGIDGAIFDRKDSTGPNGRLLAHAGLTHTYGYLFSDLRTAFGYKRARWVQDEVSIGFGLESDRVTPATHEGTLFANATYLAGRIAFRYEPRELAILETSKAAASDDVRGVNYSRLRITRLEEVIAEKGVTLRTDLVAFPSGGVNNFYWLIYSVAYLDHAELITAFPVTQSFVTSVTDPKFLGDGQIIKTRYNAYVEDASGPISGKDWKGIRRIHDLTTLLH